MKKKTNALTAVFSLTVMFVFLLTTIFMPKKKTSENENRPLAELPELSSDNLSEGEYTHGLSRYFTDHFAGRDVWISAQALAEQQICESIVNGVYISDSRLLDAGVSQRQVSMTYADYINRYAEENSGAVYMAAIPTSVGVYGDLLPEHLLSNSERDQISRFYDGLAGSIRKIDAYNILKMLSDNYIYYRSDNKWTSYGAYCVYRTVIQKLGFQPTSYDKYTISHITDAFRGELYIKSQYMRSKPDIIDVYSYPEGTEILSCTGTDSSGNIHECSIYNSSALETPDMYRFYMGYGYPEYNIKTSLNNDRRLLVICDDTAYCFIPFLTQHYSEIEVLSPEYMEGGIESYTDTDEYEQTLFIFGIDTLCENGEEFNSTP